MRKIPDKFKPSGIIEWVFAFLILYIFAVFNLINLPYKIAINFGKPIFELLRLLIPQGAGLEAVALIIIYGTLFVLLLALGGIVLVKIFNHRFSYFILFITVCGFIFTPLSWNIQTYVNTVAYRSRALANNALGEKISLDFIECGVESTPHPIYQRPLYSLVCSARLGNIPKKVGESDKDFVSLEVSYSEGADLSNTIPVVIENRPVGINQDVEIIFDLGEDPTVPNIYIKKFRLVADFDYYEHSSIEVPLSKYIK